VRAGADRLDPQVSAHLALVLAVVGEGRVGDPQVEDAAALVADQAQPRMAHDLAVCNIARCSWIARSIGGIDSADRFLFFLFLLSRGERNAICERIHAPLIRSVNSSCVYYALYPAGMRTNDAITIAGSR